MGGFYSVGMLTLLYCILLLFTHIICSNLHSEILDEASANDDHTCTFLHLGYSLLVNDLEIASHTEIMSLKYTILGPLRAPIHEEQCKNNDSH